MDSPGASFSPFNITGENSTDGMSPMTDLAANLNSLSTNLTPCRRISWSSPFSSGQKIYSYISDDSPLSFNSPSVQEGILRGIELNVKCNRKRIDPSSNYPLKVTDVQNKENHSQGNRSDCSSKLSRIIQSNSQLSSPVKYDSQSDLSGTSQESGFCDSVYEKHSDISFMSGSSAPSIRSSVFTDDEMDDDETFFSVDKFIEDEGVDVPRTMNYLFTKPLEESNNSCLNSTDSGWSEDIQQCKPSMRRHLSVAGDEGFKQYVPDFSKDKTSPNAMCVDVLYTLEESNEEEGEKPCQSFAKSFKRPEPTDITPLQCKRRKSSPSVSVPSSLRLAEDVSNLHRCYSENAATIMKAVQKSDLQPNLIGDCSRLYSLPLIHGRHQDLKTITSETLVGLIKGEFSSSVKSFTLIDCRYPYEYEGGHILGAKNIFTQEDLYSELLIGAQLPENENEMQSLIVFHCEFSSERAPKLLRFLRSKDRELNEAVYPRLHHPELYLLDGGYKAFFQKFKEYCVPQAYKPMLHQKHAAELREFRSKSKSVGSDFKIRPKLRSNLKF